MPLPLAAVVIPTFNRAARVGAAITSALEQDHPVHVVVVDDGSTDTTPAALQRFAGDRRITLVRHEINRGPSAAKNSGLEHLPAAARYAGILDSDDVLLPGAIRALVTAFDTASDGPSQVFGWCSDPLSGAATGVAPDAAGTIELADAICGRFAGEFWQLARVDLLAERRFDERAVGGESWLWWRLMREAPAMLIPDVVRHYDRSGGDRVSIPAYDARAAAGRMWAYRRVLDEFGVEMRLHCRRHHGEIAAEAAKWALLAGDRRYARRAATAAFRDAPSRRAAALWLAQLAPRQLLAGLARRHRRHAG